jgi:hypothetical protein
VAGGETSARAPYPAKPAASGTLYRLASGTVCRGWDDFLVVASQRWGELREELTSGRLASGLVASGHASRAPLADSPGTPDERLDAWLGSLPASRPALPELDVHPSRITVRASGGGTTRRTLRIGNTGFRLLHSTIRVEPPGTSWLRVAAEHAGRPVVTVESSELAVEIDLPERLDSPRSAALVVESDGGAARVEVVLEPAGAAESIEPATSEASAQWGLSAWLARRSLASRAAWIVAALISLRLLVAIGSGVWWTEAAEVSPGLAGPAALLAGLGAALGLAFGFSRGEPRDRPACAFAGSIAGLITAAVLVALARTVEAPLGGMPVGLVAWLVLGVALAGLSWWLVPETHAGEGAS